MERKHFKKQSTFTTLLAQQNFGSFVYLSYIYYYFCGLSYSWASPEHLVVNPTVVVSFVWYCASACTLFISLGGAVPVAEVLQDLQELLPRPAVLADAKVHVIGLMDISVLTQFC